MKKSLLVLAFLATLQTMLAQNITGRIVDEKNLPVEFVNVVALSLPDSAFIAGAVSDQNGGFSISTPNSKCLLKISSVGYKSIIHPLTSLQAGTIVIRNDSQLLDEVVVKAYRPAYKLTGNGITANIQIQFLVNQVRQMMYSNIFRVCRKKIMALLFLAKAHLLFI